MAEHWITVDRLNNIIEECDQHPSRIKYLSDMARGLRHYEGDRWWVPQDDFEDTTIDEDVPTSRENGIKKTVRDLVSVLLKNDPIVHTHPHLMTDADLSDEMDEILLAAWRSAGTRHVFRSMLKQAIIGGLCVGKAVWDTSNKSKDPAGEVGLIKIAPGHIRLDPYASNERRGRDIRYAVHTTKQTPEAVIWRYEQAGAKALGLTSALGRKSSLTTLYEKLHRKVVSPLVAEEDGQKVDRRVEVHEFWLFPLTQRESEPATGTVVDEKKYPYGAVVTMINDEIVREIPNPYYKRRRVVVGEGLQAETKSSTVGHRLHPFVLLYWQREDDVNGRNGIYDCEGAVDSMIPIQNSADRVGRNIEINARTTANPSALYIQDALEVPEGKIQRKPGEMIPINSKYVGRIDDVFRNQDGQQLPQYVLGYWQEKKNSVGEQAGLRPGMVGLAPVGTSHTDPATVGTIQEASYSSMWTPDDEIVAAITDIAVRYIGLIQQYYKAGRLVDISENAEARFTEIESRHLAAAFELIVVSGTTTPLHDIDREARLVNIKTQVDQVLAIDDPWLMRSTIHYLTNLRYPYAYDWIQLLRERIAVIEQEQQQLQQMGEQRIADALQAEGQGQGPRLVEQGQGGGEESLRAFAEEAGIPVEELYQMLA